MTNTPFTKISTKMTSKTPHIVESAFTGEHPNMYVSDSKFKYFSFEDLQNNSEGFVYRVHTGDIHDQNTETEEALYIHETDEEKIKNKEGKVVIYTKKSLEKNILVNKLRKGQSQKIELDEGYIHIKYEGRNFYDVFMSDLALKPIISAQIKYKYNIIKFCREVWINKLENGKINDEINTLKYRY